MTLVWIVLTNALTATAVWEIMRLQPKRIEAEAYRRMVASLTPADQHWLRKNNGKLEVIVEGDVFAPHTVPAEPGRVYRLFAAGEVGVKVN